MREEEAGKVLWDIKERGGTPWRGEDEIGPRLQAKCLTLE